MSKHARYMRTYRKRKGPREKWLYFSWRWSIKKKYGLSESDYAVMYTAQGGRCAICKGQERDGTKRLSVDHNHVTGKVRGLLCDRCNRCLGGAMDNPDRLEVMAAYLRERD